MNTNSNDNPLYSLVMEWKDEKKSGHSLVEKYENIDIDAMKSALCEYLDLYVKKGEENPSKPDPEKIRNNLTAYTDDEEFIENTISRMNGAYDFYCRFMNAFEKSDVGNTLSMKFDDNTTITVM